MNQRGHFSLKEDIFPSCSLKIYHIGSSRERIQQQAHSSHRKSTKGLLTTPTGIIPDVKTNTENAQTGHQKWDIKTEYYELFPYNA